MSSDAPGPPSRSVPAVAHPMVAVGVGLIALQLCHRAWALLPGYFYADDYNLLADARREGLSAGYLLEPFNSHIMPASRLLIWVVEASGPFNWPLAVALTLTLQAAASLACLWMLVTLFGGRWWTLAPLVVYLTSAITAQASLWWISSLNQISIQATFFLAVGAWVRYLRTRRLRWLAATAVAVATGLLFFQKSFLVLPVLVFLALVYFTTGSPMSRIAQLVRSYWPAAVVLGGVTAGYALYSISAAVPQPFRRGGDFGLLALVWNMLGTVLAGALGGPWRWQMKPGGAWSDAPLPVLVATVAVALGVAAYSVVTRRRAFWAWVLLAAFLGMQIALIATSRAPVFGSDIGRAFRLQTDSVCAVVLCLGLAFAPLLGALQSSTPRAVVPGPAFLARPFPALLAAGAVGIVAVSGLASWASYVRLWHQDSAGAAYFHAAEEGLRGRGTLDLADQVVPPRVVPGFSTPYNTTRELLPMITPDVRFPASTDSLIVLDKRGNPKHAFIDPAARSGKGPDRDCGWMVRGDGRTIPLATPTFDFTWWVKIGYLGSAQDTVQVRAGRRTTEVAVRRGLHDLFVRADGPVSAVTISGLDPATTLCVDTVEVGLPVAGARL